jgi:glucosamine 6-phosphate synthetase-like amidotransferase/phosphosugar isomerase protein
MPDASPRPFLLLLRERCPFQATVERLTGSSSAKTSAVVANRERRFLGIRDHTQMVSRMVHAVPPQLPAYHTAMVRGNDVDKPRNIAKSVTVE